MSVVSAVRASTLVDAVTGTRSATVISGHDVGGLSFAVTCDPAEIATHDAVQSAVHAIWWAWDDND